jgi:signal transduction histidine kinase
MGDPDPGKSSRAALLKSVDELPRAASRSDSDRVTAVDHDNRTDMLEVDQVVHDVANLLTSIAARATWLLRRGSTNEQEQSLRIIEQAADDAMHVLRRLQPQALQELHASSAPQQHDVRDLMQSSLEIVRSRWLGRAIIDVDIDLGPHSLWVDGSGVELREAFINVLCNAVDAMPRGGLLRIRSQFANNEIALSISDNGIGMNADIAGQAFAAYFTTKGDAGSGLGLSVSQRILTKHGGRMTLSSTQGVGTTVSFHLPSCPPR